MIRLCDPIKHFVNLRDITRRYYSTDYSKENYSCHIKNEDIKLKRLQLSQAIFNNMLAMGHYAHIGYNYGNYGKRPEDLRLDPERLCS